MKLPGLLTRTHEALPGISGPARVDRRTSDLLHRLKPGDIAILDQLDLDRRTAEALIDAEVAGVVNASPSISGRFPNLGPEVLLAADIPLIDAAGADVLSIKDGAKVRLYEGTIQIGEQEIATGVQQTPESVADQLIEAKAGMSAQLEAFSANTIEFLRRERSLILDGVGVPELAVSMEGRQVLVVAPGHGCADELRKLKKYIRDYRPVLIGVDAGAETLYAAGYHLDVIVGDPDGLSTATLKAASEVVVPAQTDGHAPGLDRIQDLGIGAVTFPASANPEDLALLLAEAHGASLVVTLGFQASLREFLDRGRSGSIPSTFLTRLKLGDKLIDSAAVRTLYRSRVPAGAVLLLVVAVLAALVATLLVSGVANVYPHLLVDAWHNVANWAEGLF